jgi:signal peptidase I
MARPSEKPKKSKAREYAEIIATAVVLAMIVRTFIIQSYHIPSESMEDTLLKGDFLCANKFLYGAKAPFIDWRLPAVRDPRPGDIVIFKFPGDEKTDYIKRCVAVSGQTVEVKDTKLFIDGVEQMEDYVKFMDRQRKDFGPYVIPEGHIFVMGDNRDNSWDSRFFRPHAVDRKLLRGKALFIYFSVQKRFPWIRFNRIGDIIR